MGRETTIVAESWREWNDCAELGKHVTSNVVWHEIDVYIPICIHASLCEVRGELFSWNAPSESSHICFRVQKGGVAACEVRYEKLFERGLIAPPFKICGGLVEVGFELVV